MITKGYKTRRLVDQMMRGMMVLCTVVALIPLFSILVFVSVKGLPAINFDFFFNLPKPVGEAGGGMGNAILGSLTLVFLATAISAPIGLLAGIYLAEYGRGSHLASAIRFGADVMSGVPSIVVGVTVFTLAVQPFKHFSAWAGALALTILMIPTITRTTEEMLLMVPDTLREAALALGMPRWRAILDVAVRGAAPGIVTGVMLAMARAAGETAPLLFTAFGSRFWPDSLNENIAALPLQIFTYAISPYEEWHNLAWAGSVVLIGLVLISNLLARLYVTRR